MAGSDHAELLQIVPVVNSITVTGANSLQLQGRGFQEGNNSQYDLAGTLVTDASVSSSPIDVAPSNPDNSRVDLTSLPAYGAGNLVVTTAGGSSAPVALAAGLQATVENASPSQPAVNLIPDYLQSIVQEALARWVAAGISADQVEQLQNLDFQIVDLDAKYLALASYDQVLIDRDAAGYGWFVDPTPEGDDEFALENSGTMIALPWSDAADRMDLLTAISHEIGHILGLEHAETGLMADSLASGTREVPDLYALDVVHASGDLDQESKLPLQH